MGFSCGGILISIVEVLLHLQVTGFSLNVTSVTYPKWWQTWDGCPGLTVCYSSDFQFNSDQAMTLLNFTKTNIIVSFDAVYNCESENFAGCCNVTHAFNNNDHIRLVFFLKFHNGSETLLAVEERDIDLTAVRGPFVISSVEEIKMDAFTLYWTRPWLERCNYGYGVHFVEENCISTSNISCGSSEMFRPSKLSTPSFFCTEASWSAQQSNCSRIISGLKPFTTYSYRVRYSIDIFAEEWSLWSDPVTVTTLSRVPKKGPTISCTGQGSSVLVTWKKPDEEAHTKISYFKIHFSIPRSSTYKNLTASSSSEYSFTIPASQAVTVLVHSCSNGGCSSFVSPNTNLCQQGPRTSKPKVKLLLVLLPVLAVMVLILLFVGYKWTNRQQRMNSIIHEFDELTVYPRAMVKVKSISKRQACNNAE